MGFFANTRAQFSSSGKRREAQRSRAYQGARRIARRQFIGRFAGSRRLRVSAAQLSDQPQPALPGGVPAARLRPERGTLGAVHRHAHSGGQGLRRGHGQGDDPGESGRVQQIQRQHVFVLAHQRRLGDVHHPGTGGLYRQPLPHHRHARQPRPGGAFDGRLRHVASGDEVSGGVFQHLRDELVLPDE